MTLEKQTYALVDSILKASDSELRTCLDNLLIAVCTNKWLEANNKQRLLIDRIRHGLVMEWKRREALTALVPPQPRTEATE